MFEGQFLQFTAIEELEVHAPLLPIVYGRLLSFFSPIPVKDFAFTLFDVDCETELIPNTYTLPKTFSQDTERYAPGMFGIGDYAEYSSGKKLFPSYAVSDYLEDGQCFRIRCKALNDEIVKVEDFSVEQETGEILEGDTLWAIFDIENLSGVTFPAGSYKLSFKNFLYNDKGGLDIDRENEGLYVRKGSRLLFRGGANDHTFDVEFTSDEPFTLNFRYYIGIAEEASQGTEWAVLADEIKLINTDYSKEYFSQPLKWIGVNNEDRKSYAHVEYACDSETFGLPFTIDRPIRQCLPIWLNKPQFKQKDEIYQKLNGEQVVLYATVDKEWEAQTDYLPEWYHDRIILALSCDRVYVNGERLTKSDNYEIDWDNHQEDDQGRWLAKAKWKMSGNITKRNNND